MPTWLASEITNEMNWISDGYGQHDEPQLTPEHQATAKRIYNLLCDQSVAWGPDYESDDPAILTLSEEDWEFVRTFYDMDTPMNLSEPDIKPVEEAVR
jgi:hypothetical protein